MLPSAQFVYMQHQKDYFRLEETQYIQGSCTEFISDKEKQWRDIDKLEEEPFRRVATYIRNNEYNPNNTRTPHTLQQTLHYLIQNIFPLMFKPSKLNLSNQRIALFLEERLVALRCEYFVQGVIYPKEILKVLKCMVVVWTMKGINTKSCDMAGLQFLLQPQSKSIMHERFGEEYRQALRFAIFTTKIAQLPKLLTIHEEILDDQELSRLLGLRLKIEQNNYELYYASLSQEDASVRCLMWLRIQQMKSKFIKIVRKSFGDVQTKWLFERLCVSGDVSGEWMAAKQVKEEVGASGKYLGFREWIDESVLLSILA